MKDTKMREMLSNVFQTIYELVKEVEGNYSEPYLQI